MSSQIVLFLCVFFRPEIQSIALIAKRYAECHDNTSIVSPLVVRKTSRHLSIMLIPEFRPVVGLVMGHLLHFEYLLPLSQKSLATGLLVDFDQHVTCFHVVDVGRSLPDAVRVVVETIVSAVLKPPAMVALNGTRTGTCVVITVRGTEHHIVGVVKWICYCCSHGIPGVSAVPVDRQSVVTDLVTDGERRVFSRVPLIISTLNLTHTRGGDLAQLV